MAQISRQEEPLVARGRAPLIGLVLCGGAGSRLGRDKGELDFHGRPQAAWAYELLRGLCGGAYVSVRVEQAPRPSYARLPLVIDRAAGIGPAAGLLAAWDLRPDAAWLVLAADLPLVNAELLGALCEQRTPEAIAVAFRHSDGTPEPLCAIYEPAARAPLEAQAAQRRSLRALLEAGPSRLLTPSDPGRLRSVNTPADEAALRRRLKVE